MSYLIFILKELTEFSLLKGSDEIFYEEIRYAKRRIIKLKEEKQESLGLV